MSVSRPFLLVLVGVVLLGATFFTVQNAQNSGSGSSAPGADGQTPATPAQAEPAPQLSPEQALKSAFTTDPGSARFELDASLSAQGQTGTLELNGATDDSAKDPRLALDLEVSAPGTKIEGGFVTTDGKAWFTRSGTGYLVPQEVWDGLVKSAGQAQPGAPAVDPAAANPVQQLPFDPAKWITDVKDEGSESIDGVETRHVSASLDAGAAARDLLDLARRQGGAQVAALPKDAVAQIEKSVKRADFDVWVGEKDKVLRRLDVQVELALPGSGPAKMSLALVLSDVGRKQQIDAPARVSEKLPGGELGTFMRTVLEGSSLATGADPSLVRAGLQATDNPKKLQRALREQRKVVLFFANSRGLDDKLVESSVRVVRDDTKAVVLTDVVANVDRYGSLVESLGVSQTPAIVVIDRAGKARLIEGYVDAASLVQVVTDAR